MTFRTPELADFGWTSFFASQLEPDDGARFPVRVIAVHRDRLHVAGPGIDMLIPPITGEEDDAATVGDWLLLDPDSRRAERLLARKSVFKRRAAGTTRRIQLICANVDTLFIVSSCNQDFNLARLERYLALASEAEVMPVVVLTKADLAEEPETLAQIARGLMPSLLVEFLDARDPASVARLAPWCGRGQTVALVGSSGVGKSTLINSLVGSEQAATHAIRARDDTGMHTTTARALHRLPAGGWLVDTPGMRELQLTDAQSGVESVFADVVALSQTCRFSDCRHETEPGCAIRAAIEDGSMAASRVKRWQKLAAEEARNTESLADRRARSKAFGKMAKRIMKEKRSRQGG
ncbi:MAG: ribosome small subunit-dependent GTPase A [Alphaproteobacteria bacterium]|nr:ribosome small subunit-dependent GTPase A [Alphaproteobacteria bacterium]